MKPNPRAAGSLRLNATIAAPPEEGSDDPQELIFKQKEVVKKLRKSRLTWDDLTQAFCGNGMSSSLQTTQLMQEFKKVIRSIVGPENSFDTVDDAAIFVFQTFYHQPVFSKRQLLTLRQMFGPVESVLAERACEIVNEMLSITPSTVLENFLGAYNSSDENEETFFGKKFNVLHEEFTEVVNNLFYELDGSFKLASEPFNMKYVNSAEDPKAVSDVSSSSISGKFDFHWLKNQIDKNFVNSVEFLGKQGLADIATSTISLLSLTISDEALQNELFELLGFDRFELIQLLLEHRQKIVKSCPPPNATSFKPEPRKAEGKPVTNIGVLVQSEQEKIIQKWARKEEKKMQRVAADTDAELDFDPQFLRAQREMALTMARSTPILSQRGPVHSITYPNVYDSYLDARNMPGFISGVKIMLPPGMERKSNNVYELVDIPPNEPGSGGIPKKLVAVSDLDQFGQAAFQGTKFLNHIQSIVFDAAYHTNTNLLICAPTGAGKTNIAMLCVIREIKKHIVEGKIHLDQFKIVYIAPMKALAAEMVNNFGKRLAPLGIKVRELTGDMQLTKSEIKDTQMLVTTPEKWDVVTRKSTGDVSLALLVKLLIIDEVHLLHGDRGPVLETLVARTLRQVEASQSMIRIVGLSATLPNYVDVAHFLSVDPYTGLFYFDGRFRPVPLGMTFIGIKALNSMQQMKDMDTVCYERILSLVRKGHQVMIFVHARVATVKTATVLRDIANTEGDSLTFSADQSSEYGSALKQVMLSRNKQLRELFPCGFAFHHAGVLRQDRNLVERLFCKGLIKVLVCTATLAWGVNLPAHAVIIRGTELYDAKHGSYVDLGILDVMQIFGRAGRPQYDSSGHGTIITTHDKLAHYLSLLTCQYPIESQFVQSLVDNLNAEVALGTVTNIDEAIHWLSYTYLYVRMRRNPLVYGLKYDVLKEDPDLFRERRELILKAARELDKAFMIRFEENTGFMYATDLGRTSSHFYIKHATVEIFNEKLRTIMTDAEIMAMVSNAQEFDQLKVRDDELEELDEHLHHSCRLPVPGGSENPHGKVNILMQTYIAQGRLSSFSLISDQAYVMQNASRIIRGLFEIVLRKNWSIMAGRLLVLCKVLEHQLWSFQHPLQQFKCLGQEILEKIERQGLRMEKLQELKADEIGHLVRHLKMGKTIKRCVEEFPQIGLDATIQPITRTVLRVHLTIAPEFQWNDHVHGKNAESFWVWVEDPNTNHMYHSEFFLLTKKQVVRKEAQTLVFTIPIFEPLPTQYLVRAESDRWLGSSSSHAISFQHLILPERHPPHTDLLDLRPLPVTALQNSALESLYTFTHFNPIQTQIFHMLYHTDNNVLLGAPTGSGKTIVAEIAIFRVFSVYPGTKVVYIAPLKALVRERIDDWKERFEKRLNRKVVELTGDVTPDVRAIESADVIVTTPEKWDGISRSWQTRNYVKAVSLIVIDEIHLLGEERGPVLEVIVSRTNFISSSTGRKLRVIGLSTALANARDLADWLGINLAGLYNFRPSVRPVPMEVHIQGFPGKHYCPRMATMNKPVYQAIKSHSPRKPVLIFVSSRRQTRLTATDLTTFLAVESNPKQWLRMPEDEIDRIISTTVKDINLKLTLAFGIAIHHAGLHEKDRKVVEQLFVGGKIQVLIATATLAWGVNFPAHLVIVKGTEYYDAKTRRYVDFPITDVLQMIGRAGRPQFDDHGVAVVLVHDVKKHFYKKFLYEPFPVESSLLKVLHDHLNAELVAGTISSMQDAMDYLTWTYFFRRLLHNPSFYNLEDLQSDAMNKFLSGIVQTTLFDLQRADCVEFGEDCRSLIPTTIGRISSFYYLSYKTVHMFKEKLSPTTKLEPLLEILCAAHEYEELPVRHNEDTTNSEFAKQCPLPVNPYTFDSPHTKAHLLFQAHFSRLEMPNTDYITDQKSVLDQAIRILQAMIDTVADQGWLCTTLLAINLMQMVIQARWSSDSAFLTLPHIDQQNLYCFTQPRSLAKGKHLQPVQCLPELMDAFPNYESLATCLRNELDEYLIEETYRVIKNLPIINVKLSILGWWENGSGQQKSKPVPIGLPGGRIPDSHWIKVHADQDYLLNVELTRSNSLKRSEKRAHAPKFPKIKDEGWLLVLGDREKKEVMVLKRIGFVNGRHNNQLAFCTSENVGRIIYTIYFMSDCYLGLDQQHDICLEIIPASVETQFNTEVSSSEDENDKAGYVKNPN